MNSILEKEKKLNIALAKLKNLNLEDPDIKKNIEILGEQKNQLEIEKSQLEKKYKTLVNDHDNLSRKLEELQNLEIGKFDLDTFQDDGLNQSIRYAMKVLPRQMWVPLTWS